MNKILVIIGVLIVLGVIAWLMVVSSRPQTNFIGEPKPYVPDNLYQPEIR